MHVQNTPRYTILFNLHHHIFSSIPDDIFFMSQPFYLSLIETSDHLKVDRIQLDAATDHLYLFLTNLAHTSMYLFSTMSCMYHFQIEAAPCRRNRTLNQLSSHQVYLWKLLLCSSDYIYVSLQLLQQRFF